jgi:hypothetical protein
MNRARESMWKKSVYISPSPKTREKFSDVGVREMKRAYLFGGAALLILLIVVAYFSSARNEVDAPVVGPIAPPEVDGDPVVRKLLFDGVEEGVDPLKPTPGAAELLLRMRPPPYSAFETKPIGGPKPLDPRLMQELQLRARKRICRDPNAISYDPDGYNAWCSAANVSAIDAAFFASLEPIKDSIFEALPWKAPAVVLSDEEDEEGDEVGDVLRAKHEYRAGLADEFDRLFALLDNRKK